MRKKPSVRVLIPEEITADKITANNADDETVAEYDPAKTYAMEEKAVDGDTVYEAVKEISGVKPSDGVKAKPQTWIEVRTVNPLAMFNGVIGDATKSAKPWPVHDGTGIQVEFRPGRVIGGLSLFDVEGERVRVEYIDDNEGVVYDKQKSLRSLSGINSYWTYWFTPVERRRDVFFDDFPAYVGTIRISIQGSAAGAACGVCVAGQIFRLGYLEFSSGGGVLPFAGVVRDKFGRLLVRPGGIVKTFNYQFSVAKNRSDANVRKLTQLTAQRIVVIGVDLFESSLVYGIYEDFRFVYDSVAYHNFSLEMVGMT